MMIPGIIASKRRFIEPSSPEPGDPGEPIEIVGTVYSTSSDARSRIQASYPSSRMPGDFCVMQVMTRVALETPAGWTKIATSKVVTGSGVDQWIELFTRTLPDPAPLTFEINTLSGSSRLEHATTVFRANRAFSIYDINSTVSHGEPVVDEFTSTNSGTLFCTLSTIILDTSGAVNTYTPTVSPSATLFFKLWNDPSGNTNGDRMAHYIPTDVRGANTHYVITQDISVTTKEFVSLCFIVG